MTKYEGSYKVINLDWRQSLPEIFDTFAEAFKAQQQWDKGAVIQQILGDSVDTVWTPDYENPVLNPLSR